MATISTLGPVGYNPTGEYDVTKTYEKLDVVTYQGSSYVAISDSIGQLPTNTTYWNLIAQKGDTGSTGSTGNGIVSIVKTSTVGLVDTYTITYTNGSTNTFTITNGEDGEVTQAQLNAVQKEVDYNELIENALPIVTGSGTEITITNTIEDTILRLVLHPNTLTQSDTPTPTNPQTIHRVTGTNRIKVSNGTNSRFYNLQLNLGNIEYCKIGNYADRFYKATADDTSLQTGKWYLRRRIGKLDLNGYEDWSLRNLTDTNLYFSSDEIEYSVDATKTGLSSHFAYVSDLDSNDTPGFNFVTESNHLRIRIPKTLLSDVSTEADAISSFKTWLSTNSVTIYYIYPTSVFSLLPDYPFDFQESLARIYDFSKSYSSQTKLEQTINDDLPFVIEYTTFLGITSEDISSWNSKQDALVSGTNIKTINNESILGSGNINISGGSSGTNNYNELNNQPQVNSVTLTGNKSLSDLGIQPAGSYASPSDIPTESTVSGWGFTKNTGTYSKPIGGIPENDLSSTVQTSLGKADTALQSYTEQYTGTITGITMNGVSKGTSGVVDLGTVITSHQDISGKQDALVSGNNIKTINNQSLLGSGNISISGGGTPTDVQINSNSIVSNNVANLEVAGSYSSSNKIATMSQIPTDTSDLTNGAGYITGILSSDVVAALGYTPYSSANPNGYTDNVGTITSIRMNGSTVGRSGAVDLGTVITSHQDISGKQDTLVSGTNIKTINNESILGSGNINISGGGLSLVELTQSQYNNLSVKDQNTLYVITE